MSATTEPRGGPWRSPRQLLGRTPLRVKLITAVLTLVAIALVIISVAGIGFLRKYLLQQQDTVLQTTANQVSQPFVQRYLSSGHKPKVTGGTVEWIPAGGRPEPTDQPVTGGLGMPSRSGTGSLSPPTQTNVPGPAVHAGDSWLSGNGPVTVAATSGGGRWRVIAIPDQAFTIVDQGAQVTQVTGTVVVGIDVTSVYQTVGRLVGIDVVVSAILLLGLAVVGVAVIRASLRPLTDIERTAEIIAAGDISRRVPDRDPHTEIGRLGRSLNAMLSQIESAFNAQSRSEAAARRSEERMRQFVADASHELRTPLTAIRGFAEYYRQLGGIDTAALIANGNGTGTGHLAPADLDRIMRRVEQESSRMGILVEDMLLLARMDQQRPLEQRTVDLLTLAADAVHDARVVAPARSINLTVSAGAALLVVGDEVRLRQVIGNLMSNALSHTPDGTPIDVRIRSGSLDEARANPAAARPRSAAVLEFIDHGPGLTREQGERAFERFYRADQARTTGGGNGLGLAIVAALVAAHGGAVWVESAPGAGATFRIALPLAPEALHDASTEHDDDEHDDSSAADDSAAADSAAADDSTAHDSTAQDGTADDSGAEIRSPGLPERRPA
jgi:two-component system OmpR family sensor kinase